MRQSHPFCTRKAKHPDLRTAYLVPEVAAAKAMLQGMALFRGVSDTRSVNEALWRMRAGEPTAIPLMWGFREYAPGQALARKEILVMETFARDAMRLNEAGGRVQAHLILADLHAEHNNVPPDAIPPADGGNGREGYRAYYGAVAAQAGKLGIPVVMLSTLIEKLGLDPHDVAARGASLVRLRGDDQQDDPRGSVRPTAKDLAVYARQALRMVARYPTVPVNRSLLKHPGSEEGREQLNEKALDYMRFRKGEGGLRRVPRHGSRS